MLSLLIPLGMLAAAGAAAQPAEDERPVIRMTVYGNDPCPQTTSERIVVRARRPERDRYRIPEQLREDPDQAAQSWAERAEALETVGETGIQSCSTVGPGGFTGCWEEMLRQARQERERQRRRGYVPER